MKAGSLVAAAVAGDQRQALDERLSPKRTRTRQMRRPLIRRPPYCSPASSLAWCAKRHACGEAHDRQRLMWQGFALTSRRGVGNLALPAADVHRLRDLFLWISQQTTVSRASSFAGSYGSLIAANSLSRHIVTATVRISPSLQHSRSASSLALIRRRKSWANCRRASAAA
jgi:hypothetical protein